MARGRLISKSLGSSRKFHAALTVGGKIGEFCQVLYPLLIANADECGRQAGDAFTVKNVVLPSSPRHERDFEQALDILATVGLIHRYDVSGAVYLLIHQFEEYQHLNLKHRGESRFPSPEEGIPLIPRASAKLRTTPPLSLSLSSSLSGSLSGVSISQAPPDAAEPVCVSPPDGFTQFWDAYPKKKAKDDARKAWEKRRPDGALLLTILAAIATQRQSPDWQKENGRYIPFPATWLNRGQWTDSPDELGSSQSETTRFNVAASEEAERLILEHERGRTHGHRRQR